MRLSRVKSMWLLLLGFYAIPYVVLFAAGSLWLYQQRWLMAFAAATGALMLVGWPILKWLRRQRKTASATLGPRARLTEAVAADPRWPPVALAAWAKVETIARRMEKEDPPLDNPEWIWALLREIFEAVAQAFHPAAAEPALETPLPHVLRTAELVARDLHEAFAENVPGAHILTLGDFKKLKRLADWGRQFYYLYRVMTFGFNPYGALVREARDAASDKMLATSTDEVKAWAIEFCVRKAGFYAIQLYGGYLPDDAQQFQAYLSPHSQALAQAAEQAERRADEEPLRIMLAGQAKSGKSSLVNALFGEIKAAVDVLPATRGVEPYLLARDGIPRAILLDTAGYDAGPQADDPFKGLGDELLRCDLVLVVCTAASASRAADRKLLDRLRAFFLEHPRRAMPAVAVALTHIDLLRPVGEWAPPYDLTAADNPKAASIRDAAQAVADDLALTDEQLVVPVCLEPHRVYNVEEGLAPAIFEMLPTAQRARYLRCLRESHEADYWQRLWRQTVNSGRVLWTLGKAWLDRSAHARN
jgi:uncharacterized protein